MTEQQLNCSTCPYNNKQRLPAPHDYECYCQLKQMWVHQYCYVWFTYTGCFSHPSAKELLMKDAIKELEKEIKKSSREIIHEYLEQDTYREGIIWMGKKAIALIKGVK